jgi:CheY-like chemotaxis protein
LFFASGGHALQTGTHRRRRSRQRVQLSALISHWGHQVAIAENGRDAVLTAKAFDPEVAILDLDMPYMDGFEAARALRNREAQAVIVALTGLPPALLPERMLDSCFDRQYSKPISTEQLNQLLNGE